MTVPMPIDDAKVRSRCAVLAARLTAQQPVAAWSLMQSAASILALAALACGWAVPASTLPLAAWGFGALLGLGERYLTLRLRLDEALFSAISRGALPDLYALDDGLAWLGLRLPNPDATRALDNRLRGTQALLRRHVGVAMLQTLCVLIALTTGLHAGFPSP